MSKPPKIRISERELQYKFNNNEGGYKNRMDELEISCSYDEPASPKSGQDPGTTSKIFKFRENGATVMILHFFLRSDGSLGASGKFDPKNLLIEGILYYK
jgi:hypothetical protein